MSGERTLSSMSKALWPYSSPIPQRFSSKYQRYLQLGGLVDVAEDARAYINEEPIRDVERFIFLCLAFDQIHKEALAGDFAELGVYQGSTAAVLARHAQRLNRHLFLLDTYEGFDKQDFSGMDAGRQIGFTDTSLEAVRARVGDKNTSYIKGYFPDTADLLPEDGQYCLVHIDTDLYAPIMSGLTYFYPRMVPGGFLIVHDYGSLAWEGAEKAVDVFFADKPECVIQVPDSCGSAVIRKMRPPGPSFNWIAARQVLRMGDWYSAANGHLSIILTEGWSSPEAWGTWGVGKLHRIKFAVDNRSESPIIVDLDTHAFVWDEVDGRCVDILVNGEFHSRQNFNVERAFVSLAIQPVWPAAQDAAVTIDFRPQKFAAPSDIESMTNDTRELGVALHRIRIRPVGTT